MSQIKITQMTFTSKNVKFLDLLRIRQKTSVEPQIALQDLGVMQSVIPALAKEWLYSEMREK